MRRFVPFALLLSFAVFAIAGTRATQLFANQLPGEEESPVKVEAQFTAPTADQPAKLFITAKIAEPWHIYAITQKKGGPLATKITLAPSDAYLVDAEFRASPPPEKRTEPELYADLVIEEHEGEVTWWVPIEFANGIDPSSLTITGKINVQACNDQSCLPPRNYPFSAVLGEGVEVEDAAAADGASTDRANLQVVAEFTAPSDVQPARLYITAKIAEPWHINSMTQKKGGPRPTEISLAPSDAFQIEGGFSPSPAPEVLRKPLEFPNLVLEQHEGEVTWWAPIEFAQGVDLQSLKIEGKLNVQACNEKTCLPSTNYTFVATLGKGVEVAAVPAEFVSAAVSGPGPGNPAFDPNQLQIVGDDELANMPIWLALCAGLAGGALLNLMPCVLPVIGLKILAFVEQSHHQRSRVFMLNVWYSLGLFSVFMLLASLAVFAGFGWGQLFTRPEFNVALAGIVFAMALSFLGVWEIPIPGFIGGSKAHDIASQEGVAGAFSKGAITTVLATPCTGPFLGTALAWAVRQPAYLTYAVFASVAIGMASPYLLIGLFPNLIRWLPKPGAWMDTFKQLMGFVLLGTIVYLFTFIQVWYLVPTFALLIGVWVGCWWIGRAPGFAPLPVRLRAWTEAVAVIALVAFVSFTWLGDVMRGRFDVAVDRELASRAGMESILPAGGEREGLAWQPFTKATFERLVSENKTVLVDFTADWCLVCKTLEATVLSTDEVRKVVDTNQIVALQADWTHQAPEVTEMLTQLGSKQVPVLAIFPAGRPNAPIVLRDTYTTSKLLAALEQAGPSKGASAATSTAMNQP